MKEEILRGSLTLSKVQSSSRHFSFRGQWIGSQTFPLTPILKSEEERSQCFPNYERHTRHRKHIANELKPICALVEEMLEIAKRSYGVALTASHMGHIAYEHNVTILDLSTQLATLKREISGWVMRSSQDATAAMILAEPSHTSAAASG
jgi:hypothetical protein